jgi:hypothetical protein
MVSVDNGTPLRSGATPAADLSARVSIRPTFRDGWRGWRRRGGRAPAPRLSPGVLVAHTIISPRSTRHRAIARKQDCRVTTQDPVKDDLPPNPCGTQAHSEAPPSAVQSLNRRSGCRHGLCDCFEQSSGPLQRPTFPYDRNQRVIMHQARSQSFGMIRCMNSSNSGTVNAVSPWLGLQIMPFAIN